ncbi:glycosyltransferase [Microbacterium sp. CFBP9034]|uniref:glycosyltransferase n=1 Tax=Microbacterium sp. CFBP9034 TaxID=3096540 RepID=UPI002A6B8A16|nr:glycosyltransferase [Microbacterium sp. CFBP9034]MDY0909017.1 glycosyltransferase [Microbacterium sp. CFBP9034]
MPARVHAILVVRPDGRTPAAFHLRRTLAALAEQTRRADVLTIVLCGGDEILAEVAAAAPAESVVTAAGSTGFADALALITPRIDGDAVWLLAQDTAPERDALARLAGALELSPSVAYVAPKLVRWDDRSELVSLGVGVTRLGRAVGLADDELDQGQHDGRDDVLGADVRGLLVRADAWRELGGLDPALLGADEGLDLGIRARLAGARVALVPTAIVATAGDGVAGRPAPLTPQRRRRAAFAARVAQLHRRLVYGHVVAVPFLWLAILPTALWRTVVDLVRKEPGLIGPEWAAAVVGMVRPVAVARGRRRLSSARRVPWSQLAPLRITSAQLREKFVGEADDASAGVHSRGELRFFSGGGAWLVLAALVAGIAAFPALLAWPVLGGGALQPLRTTVAQLWADAAFGQRALGLDTIGPADPFAAVIAVLGSLSPWEPSRALVVLWILALPLAALGGWFAATRVTDRSSLRLAGGVLWALSPSLLIALTQGRPAAVIAHLLLPWLFVAGSVAHRSWAGAGAASLVLAAVLAVSPSLAPALAVLWIASIVLAVVMRAGRGVARLVWTVIPTLVLAAPLVWSAIRRGEVWGLLSDPGMAWDGPQVLPDAAGRALLATGIPTPDLAGWTTLLPEGPTWWVPLLVAPLALLALAAPLTLRWAVGIALLTMTALGVATAFAAVAISVSFEQSLPVPIWPGSGLSLAWLGALGGALVTLDAGLAPRLFLVRGFAAALMVAAVAVLAVPAMTAMARDSTFLTNGPDSTLPAYVAAEGRDDPDVGTLILTPQNAGGVATRVVWGGSETLGGQTTLLSTRTEPSAQDDAVGDITADLVTSPSEDVVSELAGRGISFVLVAAALPPESDAARAMRLSAITSLNQRETLDAVGETTKGSLWRITTEVASRPAVPGSVHATAAVIAALQFATLGAALLLALPTTTSRREARRIPRVVGPHWQEGR